MNRKTTILLHSAIWLVLFLSPLSFMNHGNGVTLPQFLMMSVAPLATMIVFYADYLWLTPHYFIAGNKRIYWLVNVVMVIGIGLAMHYWMTFTHNLFETDRPHPTPSAIATLSFIVRDIFQLAIAAAIATTIQLAMRWQHSEEARLEAEAARTEAELRNLHSQINPHFLLNTLNNIYALTAFDTERAQTAIDQLSKMLRHMLYDYQQETVSLETEVQFLQNYVNLMKLRLPTSVDVSFSVQCKSHHARVAPLLFISLIENAFKHGVSPTEPSFIHICIEADEQQITCDIENSNHPKSPQDCSGHGIGLQQVERRLELEYPGRFTWERGISENLQTYHSKITIAI